MIKSQVEVGRILAISNADPGLGSFFDAAGNVVKAYEAAKLIIGFAGIYRSFKEGDKESAVVGLLEIGLSLSAFAGVYARLTGQNARKDIATIFNVTKVRDLLLREASGHFDDMPEIRDLIVNLDPRLPYSDFERKLQGAGLWHEWQMYLITDKARNY